MDNKSITQIICGVQFSNSFKIFDKWGEIADNILYSSFSKKILGEDYYTSISNDAGYQRFLQNDKTKNILRLTQNNLIITHNVSKQGFAKDYKFIKDIVLKCLFPLIVSKNILVVRRIGIVYTCSATNGEILSYKKTLLQPDYCDKISDLRFSKKETLPSGTIKQGNENYINKIVTVGNLDNGKTGFSFDYQHYYIPPNADAQKDIERIFDNSLTALEQDIFKIIGDVK